MPCQNEGAALHGDGEPTPAPCSYTVCGSAGNGCYDNATATNAGYGCLSDGTQIDYVVAIGSFKVWQEHGGTRLLHASGLWTSSSDWQQTLNRNGKGFSGSSFTTLTNIAGRACPANSTLTSVFINDDTASNKFASGYCLYYDGGNAAQRLDKDAGTEATDWLANWTSAATGNGTNAAWYEGNVKTCADKGMRLPTAFETSTTDTSGSGMYPPANGSPTFALANGVPNDSADTWTASGSVVNQMYFNWSGTTITFVPYTGAKYVRCVLP